MTHTVAAFHRWLPVACLGILIVVGVTRGKVPAPGVPAQGQGDPAPTVAEDKPIPRDALIALYRAEMGPLFHDADVDKLLAAHQLIEDYFHASSAPLRKQTVSSLQHCGVEPTILGRLCRIRMYWPALEGGIYYVNEKHGPYDVRYFLGLPAGYDRAKSWPLVVKLPPAEPFLTNPPPDADAVVKIYNGWLKEELARHADALVLMPLLNLDDVYGPSYTGMNYVIQPIMHAAERVNIDPARVYLYGHSTGGHAAWNLGMHYPTYFASIAPLAGGAAQDWQRLRLPNLRNTPPVVWADVNDDVVKVESSRALVKIMRGQKLDVDYVETKNKGHAPTDAVAEERYQKMRSYTRSLYPAAVTMQTNRPDVLFNRADWLQLWQQTDPGTETKLLFRKGTGHMTITKNSARIDAKRDGNNIDLTLDNVDSMRLYLNDQMIDFTKPLVITINKKRTIRGYAKPNIEQMMNDQLFLGRGWRYFTAILDVDVNDATTRPTTNPTSRPTTRPNKTGTIIFGPGRE